MAPKNIARLRWELWLWVLFWLPGFLLMEAPLWRAVWLGLAIVYGVAYYLVFRSKIDTERGLQKVSNIGVALIVVQIAVAIFIVLERAKK